MLGSTNGSKTYRARGLAWACVLIITVTAPTCLWAVSPDMLPSAAIWDNFMRKIREPRSTLIHEEDTNGDGVADFKVFRHEDGSYIDVKLKPGPNGLTVDVVCLRENPKDQKTWVWGYDRNGDGQIDMVVRGMFAEGKWAQMLYDSDADGRPDKFILDLDQNGVYDSMGVDDDGDGALDYLYDLDNKTGEVLNETVGWVNFKEEQRREALPQLLYWFYPELKTLSGREPIIVSAHWDYGDGAKREMESLVPGVHVYAKPGTYQIDLEVFFKLPGSDKVYRAWRGIQLEIAPPPAGPLPLTPERVIASVPTFYGACGLVTAEERPVVGPITALWPGLILPEGAPAGEALRASAIAPGELDVAVFWWRSAEEADAFLDAVDAMTDPKPDLPVLVVRSKEGRAIELVSKVRARVLDNAGRRVAAWREGGFIITLTTNRTLEELERWTRVFYDILHPAPSLVTGEAD